MLKRLLVFVFLSAFVFVLGEKNSVAFDQEDIQIHGFAAQGYLQSSGNEFITGSEDGTWAFDEVGLNLTMPIMDRLRFGMQFFMRNLGGNGNNDLTVDWAYLDYSVKDWLGLRAAKIKIPWGLYNKTRDIDSLRVSIFMPESVYFENMRDFLMSAYGASVYGTVDGGSAGYLDYEMYAGTTGHGDYQGMSAKNMKMYGGGLFWVTPVPGLKLGGTAISFESEAYYSNTYVALVDADGNGTPDYGALVDDNYDVDVTMDFSYVLSLQYEYKNLLFAAEYCNTGTDFDMFSNTGATIQSTELEVKGWYASLSWRALAWLELGTYYSSFDVDINDDTYDAYPDYFSYKKDLALTTRFNINEYMSFKLEAHLVNGLADVAGHIPSVDTDKNWEYYAAKLGINF